MTIEKAIKILNEVIPPPNNVMVDLEHFHIAQAWEVIKGALQTKNDDVPAADVEKMVHEYKISLTVRKEIDGKKYGDQCEYATTFVEYDGYKNPNIKSFVANDKAFDRKELEKLFDLLLMKFYRE